jgi:hypothetical protein
MDGIVILIPLAILPLVLLFRFVGCGLDAVGTAQPSPPPTPPFAPPSRPNPPKYRDYILWDPGAPPVGDVLHKTVVPKREDVIGYWRLIDPKPVSTGDVAADGKGSQPGKYLEVGAQIQEPFSDTAPGVGLVDPSTPPVSLIESDPQARCRAFRRGCVRIDTRPELFTPDFTIEAWVWPRWTNNIFEYTLFSAGDTSTNPALPPSRGFAVYVMPSNAWMVRLAPNGMLTFNKPPPLVDFAGKTHIALTVQTQGAVKAVRLVINGFDAGQTTVPSYAMPTGWELLIGAANRAPAPTGQQIYRPFIGEIQEVVLHKKALSLEELQNHVDINRPIT